MIASKTLFVVLILVLVCPLGARATEPILEAQLPQSVTLDNNIPSPSEFLGWQLGSRHAHHHQVTAYAQLLDELSPRLTWVSYGSTHDKRPLGVLVITNPKNHQQLDRLENLHRQWCFSDKAGTKDAGPTVMWMGYGVHGDEASATNASMLVMYLLAAGQGPWIDTILSSSIYLLDPCLNPDGMDRYAQWVNDNRGYLSSIEPSDREHQPTWPSGRLNHYGFDLNRDWLPGTQPESRGRLKLFYKWMPNVCLDFHEMGSSESFFFQPGIQGRDQPLAPPDVARLTGIFAKYHASAMDLAGERYFTHERFDDYYPGKGSTFPDLQGAIGILFEQGSSEGLRFRYGTGERTFSQTIANQLRMSLSSLNAMSENRTDLLEYQRRFFQEISKQPERQSPSAYAITIPSDFRCYAEFLETLSLHQIRCYSMNQDWTVDDRVWKAIKTVIIPADQPHCIYLRALMQRTKSFTMNKFYDVSAWSLPLAYNIECTELSIQPPQEVLGKRIELKTLTNDSYHKNAELLDPDEVVAMAIDCRDLTAFSLLDQTQKSQTNLRVMMEDCKAMISSGLETDLPAGTMIIHKADQEVRKWPGIVNRLRSQSSYQKLLTYELVSGLTSQGPDLGSDKVPLLKPVSIGMLSGERISATSAAGLWFMLDYEMKIPVTRINLDQVPTTDLQHIDCILVPDAATNAFSDETIRKLHAWCSTGGHLIALGRSGVSINDRFNQSASSKSTNSSGMSSASELLKSNAGVTLQAELAEHSSLSWGYESRLIPVFQDHGWVFHSSRNRVAKLLDQTVLNGFLVDDELSKLNDRTCILSIKVDLGRWTAMTFEPAFRGHYFGSMRILLNAIYMPSN